MKIVEALKTENIRITNGNKWMYYDVNYNMWFVRLREYRKHNSVVLIKTENEEEAVKILLS